MMPNEDEQNQALRLSKDLDFDLDGALAEGYSHQDIIA